MVYAVIQTAGRSIKMENVVMENAIYVDYSGCIKADLDVLLVSMWNSYIEYNGGDNKIFLNNKEFFENSFNNSFDAAWAATLSGKWWWTDDFVYFNREGYIVSFCHWDDERSPIDLDKIDISSLIYELQDLQTNKTNDKKYVNNIPQAIHEALQE